MRNKLQDLIKKKKILVVGDVMLDEYYKGAVNRISPEAPVPVFLEKEREYRLGGAANVAVNLAVNGMETFVLSVIGKDVNGAKVESLFYKNMIRTDFLLKIDKPTSTKSRLLAGNNQQVLRIDYEDDSEISADVVKSLIDLIKTTIADFDCVIISDYRKGMLTAGLTHEIISLCNHFGIKVFVDVKDKMYEKYKNAFMIKPNRKELSMLTGMAVDSMEDIIFASEKLCKECSCDYVLTTCGGDGMVLVNRDKRLMRLETTSHEVFDVTGAGDTVIAYLAMCIANQFSIEEAMRHSNVAAGIQVSKVGTSSVLLTEIDSYNSLSYCKKSKIIQKTDLETIRKTYKNQKIVFTNGCFDILHIGHLRYLREAAGLGDVLIVGVNSDASVRRLKGSGRPVNHEADRIEMLSNYDFIDYICLFDEDTPYHLIRACMPDILVKGGDYKPEQVVGRDVVEERGGKLVIIPLVRGKSTTKIVERIEKNA